MIKDFHKRSSGLEWGTSWTWSSAQFLPGSPSGETNLASDNRWCPHMLQGVWRLGSTGWSASGREMWLWNKQPGGKADQSHSWWGHSSQEITGSLRGPPVTHAQVARATPSSVSDTFLETPERGERTKLSTPSSPHFSRPWAPRQSVRDTSAGQVGRRKGREGDKFPAITFQRLFLNPESGLP